MASDARTGVVVLSRNRRESLLRTLDRLARLPERPPVVLVDNHSSDGSAEAVQARHPRVTVVEMPRNEGPAARDAGVRALSTRYAAFCDDDSWWAAGALAQAADGLDAHPRLALVAARVLVGERERTDPTCVTMAGSPLPRRPGMPGPAVLGFLACGAVVRRSAFIETGGFGAGGLGIGGEEELLAIDLASRGWELAYLQHVVAHHWPAPGPRHGREAEMWRSAVLTAWLRRPATLALRLTAAGLVRGGVGPRRVARALAELPRVLPRRRAAPLHVERALRLLSR